MGVVTRRPPAGPPGAPRTWHGAYDDGLVQASSHSQRASFPSRIQMDARVDRTRRQTYIGESARLQNEGHNHSVVLERNESESEEGERKRSSRRRLRQKLASRHPPRALETRGRWTQAYDAARAPTHHSHEKAAYSTQQRFGVGYVRQRHA